MSQFIYLHGFASSPASSKARDLAHRFASLGISLAIPQLDRGDFEGLSITGQLQVVEKWIAGKPAVLIGSSLGGYLAALCAARHPEVEKVVLLAPAFQFAKRWRARLGDQEMDRWFKNGYLEVYHYGAETNRRLGYHFIDDAGRFEDFPKVSQPCLILHGRKDEVVPWELSEEYVRNSVAARLDVLESDHQLLDVMDAVWERIREFLVGVSYRHNP